MHKKSSGRRHTKQLMMVTSKEENRAATFTVYLHTCRWFELFIYLFIKYLFFRERDCMSRGEGCRRRERERESQTDSTVSAEPDVGLDLTTLRS